MPHIIGLSPCKIGLYVRIQ